MSKNYFRFKLRVKSVLYKISAVFILISSVLYLVQPEIATWIMLASVIIFSVVTIKTPYPGRSVRGKRLFNFQVFSCMLMLASVYFMYERNNIWALAMLVAALFLLYSVSQIYRELEKEE